MQKFAFTIAAIMIGAEVVAVDLSGIWRVELNGRESPITLPGTLADAKLGTRWTREMFEMTNDHPQSGALTREYQHLGAATYTREFELSTEAARHEQEVFLERVMWASRVTLDGRDLGTRDSLSTPHVYAAGRLAAGRHVLKVTVDNSCRYGFSRRSHSYGPSGQSVWHGIIGRIEVRSVSRFAAVKVRSPASSGRHVEITGLPGDFGGSATIEGLPSEIAERADGRLVLKLLDEPKWWDAENPNLYTLVLAEGEETRRIRFGFHTYSTDTHAFKVNGIKTFVRANIDNCLFPKLGRPPMTKAEWVAIMRVLKDEDGFNAIRFHSWCPSEGAWEAADEVGIYMQPEICIWSDTWMKPEPQFVGWGDPVDGFLQREMRDICDAYGNHPSFQTLVVGNELGKTNGEFAERMVKAMRNYEPRVLHCFTSAREFYDADQFGITHLMKGVGMVRERLCGHTDWDYESGYSKACKPVIAHEIGQWPTYPDFVSLLAGFDGVMRPWNIDRCWMRAQHEGTDRFACEYAAASAKLSRLMYKDEVESFQRTASCAGIHLLDAQDYTGEGEALMGWRDPFFRLKPMYRGMKPFRSCWGPQSGLARFAKYNWQVGEVYAAKLLIRNQTARALPAGREFPWSIVAGDEGVVLTQGVVRLAQPIEPGELGEVGEVRYPVVAAARDRRVLHFAANEWSFWTYPAEAAAMVPRGVVMTNDFAIMREALAAGKTVLYTGDSRETAVDAFRPVYWSSTWFPSRQPIKDTLGVWFEISHPMLAGFPTESTIDWQWYDLVNGAKLHRLTGVPRSFRPVALSVNDFHFSMLVSSLFELRVGKGRLVVCGYDLERDSPESRRLRASVFDYLSAESDASVAMVPLSWLDTDFAPIGKERLTDSEMLLNERIDFTGTCFQRKLKLKEPATGILELTFDSQGADETSGKGTIDGHEFKISKGKGVRLIRVNVIREDMLDGELLLNFRSNDDSPLTLRSLRFIRDGHPSPPIAN